MKKVTYVLLGACMGLAMQASVHAQQIFDLRAHSFQKPHRATFFGDERGPWEYFEHDCDGISLPNTNRREMVPRYTQANLESLIDGGVTISNQILTTHEEQFFQAPLFKDKGILPAIECMTGHPVPETILLKTHSNYFDLLTQHLLYVQRKQNEEYRKAGRAYSYKVLASKEDLKEVQEDPAKLGILMSLSGGHLLGQYVYIENNLTNGSEYERLVLDNIDRLKGIKPLKDNSDTYLEAPIFSIDFANLYDDGLTGKVQRLSAAEQAILGRQTTVNQGVTALGQKVIRRLVKEENGSRILVNVAGMSLKARRWYYELLRTLEYNKDQQIPILALGVGISGLSWDDELYTGDDVPGKSANKLLNHSTFNMSRQDLEAILESEGLVGIALAPKKVLGEKAIQKMREALAGTADERELQTKLIALNIVEIVATLQDAKAWEIIALSSGFDGGTVPFSRFSTADETDELRQELLKFFSDPTDLFGRYSANDVSTLMYGYTPEEIVDMISSKNTVRLLEKHFSKGKKESTAKK